MPQFPSQQSASGIWSLKKQKRAQQGSNWPLRSFGDFLWNYVTALFSTGSTNGAQNNTFLDSSGNNFTVTRNGNTTQGTFSPFGSNWSNYFDGNGDELTFTTIAVGSSTAFCCEAWVYVNSLAANMVLFGGPSDSTGGADNVQLAIESNGTVGAYFGGSYPSSAAGVITVGVWYHIAWTRSGTTGKIFVNGVEVASGSSTSAGNINRIGSIGSIGTRKWFNGYVSNARIVVGSAVYTSAFTPSTTPLTAITNTQLLTCQANRFRDASTNNFTITRTGDVSVQRFSPFGSTDSYRASTLGGSGYFDGSDYLSDIGTTSSFNFLHNTTALFTFECWVYLPATAAEQYLFDNTNGTSSQIGCSLSVVAGGALSLFITRGVTGVGNVTAYVTSTGTVPTNQWVHVAVTYDQSLSSNNAKFYINGAAAGSGNKTGNTPSSSNASNTLRIGCAGAGAAAFITGYISNLRISNSIVYSSAFTPPTAPVTGGNLLLNFTNGGIFDGAVMNDFETVGNAQVSTTQAKYGTTSMYFDGTGDWLQVPNSQNFNFGSGNFTVECWVYCTNTSPRQDIFTTPANGSGFNGLSFGINNGNFELSSCWSSGSWQILFATAGVVSANTWTHVAVVRAGGALTVFVNGAPRYSNTTLGTNSLVFGADPAAISYGRVNQGDARFFYGFIDDLRITKGYARYWYPFTPPTAALPDYYEPELIPANDPLFDYTTLLLPGNGTNGAQNNTFVDSSTNNFSITRNGNTTQGTFTPFGSNWSNYFNNSTGLGISYGTATHSFWNGDFTLEFWVNCPTKSFASVISSWWDPSFANGSWQLAITSGVLGLSARQSSMTNQGSFVTSGTTRVDDGLWHHVAVTQVTGANKTFRLFVDGVLCGYKVENNWTQGPANSTIYIGNQGPGTFDEGNRYLTGYLSNLRLTTSVVSAYSTTSTAIGTPVFTPPTTPLTAAAGTNILTCADNRYIDDSSNNFAITRLGDVSVQRFSPFNPTSAYSAATIGGSAYFDGSGDFLTVATNAAFSFGTGDFTISTWIYTGNDSLSPAGYSRSIFTIGNITGYLRISAYHGGTTGAFRAYVGASTICDGSTVKLSDNAWHHIAIVRESGTVRHWIDGVYVGAVAYSTNMSNSITNGLGADMNGPDANWNGYIGPTLVVKGTALYTGTSNITVPTAPPTAVTGTSLLTSMTNAGIVDSTMMNALETVGNAQISTAQSRFGGGSMAFDGSGDYLVSAATNLPFTFGAGDFTIEAWIYPTSVGAGGITIVSNRFDAGADSVLFFGFGTSFGLYFHTQNTQVLNSGINAIANTWQHVALCRASGTVRIFLNGNQVGGSASSAQNLSATAPVFVGQDGTKGAGAAAQYNGYIDDLRITRGVARYVQPFTPPTQAFQTQ